MTTSLKSRQARGKLRIIGGRWRGRKLQFADLPGLRPTPDRVRETLFNWLTPYVNGAHCLDLFCGSGALGLECVSRGAATVTLVDAAAAVQQSIRQNCTLLACDNAYFVHADVSEWLAQQRFTNAFDIVFVDPPYEQNLLAPTLQALAISTALKPGSWVYAEAPQRYDLNAPDRWRLHRELSSGNNRYCLFHV